ncbi:hypothetical protein [Vibrio hyugaensis]|uniref:hypothetical protein n=1 Tax=Vibrio hyugaensis TaxID=1534743 RepID=UPI003DA031FD
MATEVEPKKLIKGNITKKPEPGAPDYRKAWIANVNEYNRSKPHPFCHGIQMDTHHLISEKALEKCDKTLQKNLIDKGYNVNSLSNLVGIPATYRGACHLRLQVHRSDHKFQKDQFGEIKNFSYHEHIKDLITQEREAINKCNGTTQKIEGKRDIHIEVMDPISQELLDEIVAFEISLTRIHKNFDYKNKPYVGCGQAERIGQVDAKSKYCQKPGNNHNGEIDTRPGSSHELDSVINFPNQWEPERGI